MTQMSEGNPGPQMTQMTPIETCQLSLPEEFGGAHLSGTNVRTPLHSVPV